MGAWTTAVRSWAVGERVSAANLNAQLRDFANAFGAWTPYTPTLTYVTLGTGGTNQGWYTQIQKLVLYRTSLTLGSSGFAVAGFAAVGLPTAKVSTQVVHGVAALVDSSASTWYQSVHESSTFLVAGGAQGIVDATHPFTWAAGDQIHTYGSYEAA